MLDLRAKTLPTQTTNILDLSSKLANAFPIGVSEVLDQIGSPGLKSLYDTGSHKWHLTGNTTATVKVSEQVIKSKTPGLVWLETKGLVDIASPNGIVIPLGSLASIDAGYRIDAQIGVRRRDPYHCPSEILPKGASIQNALQPPVTAALAAELPAGSEFELSVSGSGAFQLGYYLGLQKSEKRSLTLLLQKLPEPGKVSVKFTKGSQAKNSAGYQHESEPINTSFLGKIANAAFQYMGWLKWFGSALFIFEASQQNSSHALTEFEFDLSVPEHRQAFEEIFSRCSTQKATDLGLGNSGTQEESSSSVGSSFQLADWDFSFFRFSESEKKIQLGTQIRQHFNTVQEYFSSLFSKVRLAWDWQSTEGADKRSQNASCRLNLDTQNASDFFEITQALQIPTLENAKDAFMEDFGTVVHMNIELTHPGIRKIQLSSFKDAFYAHLDKNSALIKNFEAAYQYGKLLNKSWLPRWWYSRDIQALEGKHPELAELKTEIQNAYWFGRNTHPFKGSLKRFFDTQSIAAIMRLAGADNVVIEDLSISRPGLSISTNPEQPA